jgi:hypothetical protein
MRELTTLGVSTVKVIKLPNGRRVTLGAYVNAWRTLLTLRASDRVQGFDYFPQDAGSVLREFRYGLHERINRHLPYFGRGRKWASDYQTETRRAAYALNTPRLVIDYLPPHLKTRFASRLRCNME